MVKLGDRGGEVQGIKEKLGHKMGEMGGQKGPLTHFRGPSCAPRAA